jgi:hypothetical protein
MIVVGLALPGCSTCGDWFGRNSDCSHNCWGKKPTPIQQGPIAGTYTQPGNLTAAPVNNSQPTMPTGQPVSPASQQAPVVTTTPAASFSNTMPPSPLNTPSLNPPAQNIKPAGATAPGTPASFKQLPPAELTAPAQNAPVVEPPKIEPPVIDLNVPGATTSKKTDATDPMTRPTSFPLLLGPNDTNRTVRTNGVAMQPPTVATPPAIEAPQIAAPTITPEAPRAGAQQTPPPLPLVPPAPPRLD